MHTYYTFHTLHITLYTLHYICACIHDMDAPTTRQCNTRRYNTRPYNTMRYNTIRHNTTQYNTQPWNAYMHTLPAYIDTLHHMHVDMDACIHAYITYTCTYITCLHPCMHTQHYSTPHYDTSHHIHPQSMRTARQPGHEQTHKDRRALHASLAYITYIPCIHAFIA